MTEKTAAEVVAAYANTWTKPNKIVFDPPIESVWNNGVTPGEVAHPKHYGGWDNPYETIKVIEAWELDFHLGNVVKYISRCGKKTPNRLTDLEKAMWYLQREIENESNRT